MTDYTTATLSDVDRALCDYAAKLTRTPGEMGQAEVDRLRTVGLSDVAIHDATQVIAYFNYINRIADGLGVDLEEGMPGRRHWGTRVRRALRGESERKSNSPRVSDP